MRVSGLRSPYCMVGGIVYFGRMLDKIRLDHNGSLPKEYRENLGRGFDRRCCRFLNVNYQTLADSVASMNDTDALQWCFQYGRKPDQEQIEVWNAFMRKFGWNDMASENLKRQIAASGYANDREIQTIFDFIDFDEGRTPGCREPASPE